ncbi:MAG: DUF692 domain-containing protein [Polyangiaceae bacterium]|nr:DUF692 domain-containing protein [Polyangiaceae bacterium]
MTPRALGPALGHGIGLRREHYGHVLEHGVGDVDWLEIVSENFFAPGGRPWAVLERVRAERPVAVHGVSLCIGDAGPLREDYVARLLRLVARLEPAIVSDHLCWGGLDGAYAHDLLPLPYTEEALALVVDKVRALQDRLGRRILLENVSSYLTFAASTLSEWDFLGEVARRADCGILLDVNNVVVSAKNHGFAPETYVDAIDPGRVGQLHLAGHTDHGHVVIDSHIGPVPASVWALYRRVVARMGRVPTLVEWDEQVPAYERVVAERARAAEIEAEVLDHG